MRDREHWEAEALAAIPHEMCWSARNAGITLQYLRWYREHRDVFKWAGAAAFASHRVGLALQPAFVVRRRRLQPASARSLLAPSVQIGNADLEALRSTNNRIYNDIAWAHLAYVDPAGGIDAVRRGLDGRNEAHRMREAFEMIDKGRRAGATGADDVWAGNLRLLEHEQRVNVQPAFSTLSPPAHAVLSIFTSLDFDGDHWHLDWKSHTSFAWFMWTAGLGLLLRQRSLPDITDAEQRWFWACNSVFRVWRNLDGDAHFLDPVLERLEADARATIDQHAASCSPG